MEERNLAMKMVVCVYICITGISGDLGCYADGPMRGTIFCYAKVERAGTVASLFAGMVAHVWCDRMDGHPTTEEVQLKS